MLKCQYLFDLNYIYNFKIMCKGSKLNSQNKKHVANVNKSCDIEKCLISSNKTFYNALKFSF